MSQKDMTSFFTDAVRAAKNISRFSFSFVYLYYLYRSKINRKEQWSRTPNQRLRGNSSKAQVLIFA